MLISSNPLIYLVDDDEDDRTLIRTIFATHFEDCTVRTFEDGSVLLAQLTHRLDGRLPNLIILDLDMPIFSGFELLHYLKQDSVYQSIPVAVLSGSQLTEHMDRCHALGSAAYLPKWADYDQLVASIDHLRPHWSGAGPGQTGAGAKENYRPRTTGLGLIDLPQN